MLEVLALELLVSPGPPEGGGPPGGGPPGPGPRAFRSDNSVLTSLVSVLELLSVDVLLVSVESVVEVELVVAVLLELLDASRSVRSLLRSFSTVANGLVAEEEEDDVSPLVELLLPELLLDELVPLESCDRKAASPDDTDVELTGLSAEPVVDVEPELVLDDEAAVWPLSLEFIFCSSWRSILC